MELCSTTQRISNHPKTPYHFRPKTSLTLQKTLISPASRAASTPGSEQQSPRNQINMSKKTEMVQ
ncbi:hypothetical protein OIU78_020329 [Salix suchowensis]|nr:hypothetical protein OIU78_020329 [Salix suchowensis]